MAGTWVLYEQLPTDARDAPDRPQAPPPSEDRTQLPTHVDAGEPTSDNASPAAGTGSPVSGRHHRRDDDRVNAGAKGDLGVLTRPPSRVTYCT